MADNLRFAAAITLYNPTPDMIERANAFLKCFDKVFVYDNSDRPSECIAGLSDEIVYLGGKGNAGLPHAFNCVLQDERLAYYDYLCTLDQDSIFPCGEVEKMKRFIAENGELLAGASMVAPFIDYGGETPSGGAEYAEKPWVITSGAFLNLSVIFSGGFSYDEKYFIDKFEIDLCMQTIRRGYKIYMYYGAVLKQRLGEESNHKHPNHSPLRHRYLFRNRLYFNRKFHSPLKRWVLNCLQTARHIALILLYERKKGKKVSAFFKGVADYRKGRMGKIDVQSKEV